MSIWSRIQNVFRGDRLSRELDEEMQAHIAEAIAEGRDPDEVRRAFGPPLQRREQSRDLKLAAWLDSLRADTVFGWRQLIKNKTVSGAAILSLALAIGACTAAFRLIDAMLLRPLPVAQPERLYFLTYQYLDRNGKPDTGDSFDYPLFRELRAAVKDEAELMAISYSGRTDLTYGSDQEMEKAYQQYVSGWTFDSFGLRPALGRLLTASDDLKPGAHPYAVLSHDYWARRFGRDPKAIGRTFRMGQHLYEIAGMLDEGFTGTETGTVTDVFVPTMMNHRAINEPNWGWFRTWVRVKQGKDPLQVREKLQARFSALRREKTKKWGGEIPKHRIEQYIQSPLVLEPAVAGVSGMQKTYRRSLMILGAVVALVLMIACANVANLKTAQAALRAREMALRVSIGAGRWRLVQLVLIESALVALIASLLGALLAWWSTPAVVSMINPPDNPARLILPADWRVLGFALALAMTVTFLFGLAPAMRASGVKPMSALKGGEDPHSRRRLMNALVAVQVAFCFLVHFVAGLFVATFDRLSNQPVGFSAERVLTLRTVAKTEQPVALWDQVTEHLRTVGGVESAALCTWALMSGSSSSSDIWVNGRFDTNYTPYFLGVGPRWLETMRIPLIDGRDFRAEDTYPAVAIVNETFAKHYFEGQNPVGKSFERMVETKRVPTRIVGYVRDARYRNMREEIRATAYVPFNSTTDKGEPRPKEWATFIVRTASADPLPLASILRREVPRGRSEFRVSNIQTQKELILQHTVRERLLAMLSLCFAIVALILSGVGLYGVLNYSVLQRRREIGIRIALGAQTGDVARRVTAEVFAMLVTGAFAGLALGVASERYIETILYEVKATDVTMLAIPALTIFTVALLASLPPVIHAVRIDPAATLRAE